jgi:hypothetical protein
LSPFEAEPRLHHRWAQLQGLLRLRRELRLFAPDDVDYASPQAVVGSETPARPPKK